MKCPEYVTLDEVRRVCRELGLRDWTALSDNAVPQSEADIILAESDTGGLAVDPADFRIGLEVELEHGIQFPEANVTNNHPLLTGKIVMAHFMETLDYYQRLNVAEIEGDLLKAVRAGKADKVAALYKELIAARDIVARIEAGEAGF